MARDLPYGADTLVIPFILRRPQSRRLSWSRFGGYEYIAGGAQESFHIPSGFFEAGHGDILPVSAARAFAPGAPGNQAMSGTQQEMRFAQDGASFAERSPAPSIPPNAAMSLSPAGQDALYRREAQKGVSEHTHFPGAASGVTLGPSYDMRRRSRQEIENDLTAVGVDPAVAYTLSQGHSLRDSEAQNFANAHRNDVTLTEKQQRALFARVTPSYERNIRNTVTVPLTQDQFDALVSYDYNRGNDAFRSSNVLRLVNNNQMDAVPDEMNRDNPSMIAGRRAAEAYQFQGRPFSPPPYR